ncbi:hypothetical protein BDV96DRAFT_566636, partial [Lophiotrema nucula]
MVKKPSSKIQPWKAMKTMEEAVNPDFDNLQLFKSQTTICGSSGASVSKPMDRRVGYGTPPVVTASLNESVDKATNVMV